VEAEPAETRASPPVVGRPSRLSPTSRECLRVFLTGATGYIGTAVAERLRGAGHEVSGLARSDGAAARLFEAGVRPVRGDFTDPASVSAAAAVADGVISTGTAHDGKVDGAAVGAIIEALAGSGKPFIYTSGIWIQGDTGGAVVDETAPLQPAGSAVWRPAVEELVLSGAARGVRSIVFRPAIVYGRGGGILAELVESARRNGAARYVGTGENRWQLVHVDDLADLYLLALERAPAGTVLLAGAGDAIPVSRLAVAASRGAGAGGRTSAWPLEEARKSLGAYADALALDQQTSSARARELLGWRPHRPGPLEDLEHGSYANRPA
jgi:nucleoside-diphosphate-sugar epimerase